MLPNARIAGAGRCRALDAREFVTSIDPHCVGSSADQVWHGKRLLTLRQKANNLRVFGAVDAPTSKSASGCRELVGTEFRSPEC